MLPPVRPVFRAVVETVVPRASSFDAGAWAEAEALVENALAQRPPAIRRQIGIFFRLVDTLPILFKGFSPRGPYDAYLQLAEFKSERTVDADRESLERVLYPYMVMSRENKFVADRGFSGVGGFASRYRSFLEEMTRHQEQFLEEWQRQQEVLARIEDEELRASQMAYMDKLRAASVDVVNRAVDRFTSSLAWESSREEPSAEAT